MLLDCTKGGGGKHGWRGTRSYGLHRSFARGCSGALEGPGALDGGGAAQARGSGGVTGHAAARSGGVTGAIDGRGTAWRTSHRFGSYTKAYTLTTEHDAIYLAVDI